MSPNPLYQLVDDPTQNKYLFILFVSTTLFGLSLIPAILMLFGSIFIIISTASQSQSLLPVTLISCAGYPFSVIFGLGAAWYFYQRKRYTLILVIMLIPLCNLFAAITANIGGF